MTVENIAVLPGCENVLGPWQSMKDHLSKTGLDATAHLAPSSHPQPGDPLKLDSGLLVFWQTGQHCMSVKKCMDVTVLVSARRFVCRVARTDLRPTDGRERCGAPVLPRHPPPKHLYLPV
jgi:hypothetical protein